MSPSGATAPPPGLHRELSPAPNGDVTRSAEGRAEKNSKPRNQHLRRRAPRVKKKPKAETNAEGGSEAEAQAEASSSNRKQRTRNPRSRSIVTPPPATNITTEEKQAEVGWMKTGSASSSKKQQGKDSSTRKYQKTPSNGTKVASSAAQQQRNCRLNPPTLTPGKPIFKEHLGLDALVSGLEKGTLFRAKLRCNPGDRSQGFCTIPGLPHDVFIPDWKPQNRAVEGDEVVIQLLPMSDWRNQNTPLGGRGNWKTKRTERKSSATPSQSATSNIVPFGSAFRESKMSASMTIPTEVTGGGGGGGNGNRGEKEEVTSRMPISTPITPATIEIALGDESQCAADEEDSESEEGEVVSELIAAPALMSSPSGGELSISMDQHPPLGLKGVDDLEEEEEEHDVSMVGFVTEKLQKATLLGTSAATTPHAPFSINNECEEQRPWSNATSPDQAITLISSLLNNEFQGWRATAEVVGIMQRSERRNTIVGVLKTFGSGHSSPFCLIPRDPRLPRCLLEHGTLRRSFDKATVDALLKEARQEEVTYRTLLAAKITSWERYHRHPLVEINRIVGQAGGLDVEIEALLLQERVHDDDQFTPEVLACLPAVPWSISEVDIAQRRDLRSLRIFSIDPPTARDLDDALSIESLPDGVFRIGVHIADVSHFVTPATPLDEEAAVRSTSVYLVDRVIPMLPRLLCEELCSLNPGVDRLAFSIIWEMDSKGNIKSTWAGRTIICSCGKLSYPQVQELIDGTSTPEGPLPEGVQLHGSAHSWKEVARDALKLHSVASEMRRRRFEVDGALRLDNVRLYFELDDEGKAVEYGAYQQKEANRLVEEFMLAANMTAAKIVSAAFPDRALLRRHMPPNGTKLRELATTIARLLPNAPPLDVSSAGTLQKSLSDLRNAVGPEVAEVVTLMCTKPMQTAQYFCTGDFEKDRSLWRHYALAVGHYTHFTSPIRRPGVFHAVVVGLGGSRFFDAYVPDLGIDVRVHTDRILKGGEAALNLHWNDEIKNLKIDVNVEAASTNNVSAILPVYDDVENMSKLHNPKHIEKVKWPIELRALCSVPVIVCGARSKSSGSPSGVHAKIFV
ncbi:hypothetical protein KSW81_001192 [Nannochloris sp. 'desiccata']|nr:hypothetical protein KSW81_001192 [Chlorella desiccata (nom. nud.)]